MQEQLSKVAIPKVAAVENTNAALLERIAQLEHEAQVARQAKQKELEAHEALKSTQKELEALKEAQEAKKAQEAQQKDAEIHAKEKDEAKQKQESQLQTLLEKTLARVEQLETSLQSAEKRPANQDAGNDKRCRTGSGSKQVDGKPEPSVANGRSDEGSDNTSDDDSSDEDSHIITPSGQRVPLT